MALSEENSSAEVVTSLYSFAVLRGTVHIFFYYYLNLKETRMGTKNKCKTILTNLNFFFKSQLLQLDFGF